MYGRDSVLNRIVELKKKGEILEGIDGNITRPDFDMIMNSIEKYSDFRAPLRF